ncbi:uncharacterized protein [Maniola hyperantus]|uniref:uncharacterized protein n=1 Tax=Aphantopus hyperantus TaxID=2795564 RepID=UPI002123EEF9
MDGNGDNNEPGWLDILREDSTRERMDAQVYGECTLGEKGRAVLYSICKSFRCHNLGATHLAVRIFERYLAGAIRLRLHGNTHQSVLMHVKQRLILYFACCAQLATKTLKQTARVRPKEIHRFLGQKYTLQDIMSTEREIFKRMGYQLPLFTSSEMAQLLAEEVGIEPTMFKEVYQVVHVAELRRRDLEFEVRWLIEPRCMPDGLKRVRTFHLAGGCVAAVVKRVKPADIEQITLRLSSMLQVSCLYVQTLADVITIWTTSERPKHVWARSCSNHFMKTSSTKSSPSLYYG